MYCRRDGANKVKNCLKLQESVQNTKIMILRRTDTIFLPWVSSECRMMKRVEAVVVGDHDVGVVVQQEGQHVVTLLGDGVVQRGVALRVLPV